MKKVLFLIHDMGQGGAEKVLVNLVNHMDHSKFDITVMTLFDSGENRQFLKKSIRKYKIIPFLWKKMTFCDLAGISFCDGRSGLLFVSRRSIV